MVRVYVFNRNGRLVGPVDSPRVELSDQEWQRGLSPEQYRILRHQGTESPFCGTLLDNKQAGVYSCICCRLPLFASNAKFDSGTGWPSFFQPIADENVATKPDRSYGTGAVSATFDALISQCRFASQNRVFPGWVGNLAPGRVNNANNNIISGCTFDNSITATGTISYPNNPISFNMLSVST
jgi:methionine-R-sulfoxide reductase